MSPPSADNLTILTSKTLYRYVMQIDFDRLYGLLFMKKTLTRTVQFFLYCVS